MDALNPEVQLFIQQQPQTFERHLMRCFMHSYFFYRQFRGDVCPFDPEKLSWRHDFWIARYNHLYALVDQFWRQYDNHANPEDWHLPPDRALELVIDSNKHNRMPLEIAQELVTEIKEDFYSTFADPALKAAVANGLYYWLNLRLSRHFVNKVQFAAMEKFLTIEDLAAQLEQTKLGLAAQRGTTLISGREVMLGKTYVSQRIECSLSHLNDAIGGGFGRGETTLIAGVSGFGKTVMAAQLAWDFASRGSQGVIVTTEQRPSNYIHRMVSYAAGVPFSEFTNRKDLNLSNLQAQQVDNIPPALWADPNVSEKMHKVLDVVSTKIFCMDWSDANGKTITKNFEQEMNALDALGWNPDWVIFDWVGGGLNQIEEMNHLRLYYKEAADCLINYAKRTNRIMIFMAQLKQDAIDKAKLNRGFLGECKTMADGATNVVLLSAFTEKAGIEDGTRQNWATQQFAFVDKSRNGPGGKVHIDQHFKFQKFTTNKNRLAGGS